jgi:4-hydroxy-tetrahydrodipicolinate synthase
MIYEGVITVIPTFFTNDNRIDHNAIVNHINKQSNNGISKIVIFGTTSETSTLSDLEKTSILNSIKGGVNDKTKIIIGLSGNNTPDVLKEARKLENSCDAFMLSAPYYNKPSQEGLYQHFKHIVTNIKKDFIIYNVPSRCGVNIEPETIARLYNEFNNIKAIKEASGSIQQVIKIKSLCDIAILSGDDELTLPFMSIGASGIISVISNVVPTEMIYMVDQFKNNNILEAQTIFYNIQKIIKLAFIESNPVPIKYLLTRTNSLLNEKVRLPLVELSIESKIIINNYLDTNGIIKLIKISDKNYLT